MILSTVQRAGWRLGVRGLVASNAPTVVVFQVEAAICCETVLANGCRKETGESRFEVSWETVEIECREGMLRVGAAKEGTNKEEAMPGAVVVGRCLVETLCASSVRVAVCYRGQSKAQVGDIMVVLVKGEAERQQAKGIESGQYRPGCV